MIMFWLDKFGNNYEVLKYILTTDIRHEKHTWAVLHNISLSKSHIPIDMPPPGTAFDIYAGILKENLKPVPELRQYPADIQAKLSAHPCWIKWAGVFDRNNLTGEQRKILIHYRRAFLCLLVNGFDEAAETILKYASLPMTTHKINGTLLYSSKVLRKLMLNA